MLKFTKLKYLNNLGKSRENINAALKNVSRSLMTASTKQFTNGKEVTYCENTELMSSFILDEIKTTKYTTFEEITAIRRKEAQKSVLVQVNSENSHSELCSYCSQFDPNSNPTLSVNKT